MSEKTTPEMLENLGAEALAADSANPADLVGLGTQLEKALAGLAKDDTPPRDLARLSLQVLRVVYEGKVADGGEAMGAVAGALVAAGGHLAGAEDAQVDEAMRALQAQLTPPAEPEPTEEPEDAEAAEPTAEPQPEEEPEAAEQEEPPQEPTAVLPEDAEADILGEFIVECLDHISAGEAALLELESNPDDAEQVNTIFRAFHTIKGTSGFLGLSLIQETAHKAENLLDRAREGEIRVVGGYADLALNSCDKLRQMIEGLQGVQPGEPLVVPDDLPELLAQLADPEAAGISEEADSDGGMRVGDIVFGRGLAWREDVERAASSEGGQPIGQKLVREGVASPKDVAGALRAQKAQRGGAAEASVRVGTDRLDSLFNMVGELVIGQSMIAQDSSVTDGTNHRLSRNVSHSGKIIRELQDLTLSLRMVPLKGVFQKMARLVRDLARKSGRDVRFEMQGEDTEIDRNMVEALKDPLVHMMRNAVDHGVEPAEDRAAAGKERTGTVQLRAYHSAGNVVIEIVDDGKGLDKDALIAKAVERQVIEPGRELSESEAFMLIFAPGFSTARQVTDVSGRGVGMDVVKRALDALRGRVEVASTKGEGTKFTIRLPLTMAISDAMLVRVGGERYLVPTVSIQQSFRPEPGTISTVTGRGELVKLRGDLMPVFRLHRLFDIPEAVTDVYDGLLIVIEGEGRHCALMVDELLGQQQVVIKSLGQSLGEIPGVTGGAILGDGQVGLILDPAGLLDLADGGREDLAAA